MVIFHKHIGHHFPPAARECSEEFFSMDSVANVAGFGLGGVIEISDDSTPQQTAEYVASVPTFVIASGLIGQPASLGALLTSVVVWPTSCPIVIKFRLLQT